MLCDSLQSIDDWDQMEIDDLTKRLEFLSKMGIGQWGMTVGMSVFPIALGIYAYSGLDIQVRSLLTTISAFPLISLAVWAILGQLHKKTARQLAELKASQEAV
jgi:hypothetical protein